jgi:hypothetical protein
MCKVIPNRNILCKDCNIEKPSNKFHWRVKDNVTTLDSRTCGDCKAADERAIRRHKKNNPYPLNSKCECCSKVSKLHCDHSHTKSKKFRGWLCSKCNVGIGSLGDNIVGIKRALKYLQNVA